MVEYCLVRFKNVGLKKLVLLWMKVSSMIDFSFKQSSVIDLESNNVEEIRSH
jgi:hypothetical protein